MNVLYISYDGLSDPLGQSQVIPYLIGLSKKGHSMTVISCEKREKYEKQEAALRQQLTQANIRWIPTFYSTLPSFLSKQLNLFFIKKEAFKLAKKKKLEAVHCRSYMAALIGLQLKRTFGIKFVFDMRGFWADERIDGNIWSLKSFLQKQMYRYFKKKEIQFLQEANYTISLTENAKKEILSWELFKEKPIPIEVIPCCTDLSLFNPARVSLEEKEALKEKLNIQKDDFILSYLGSIGTWYMLDEMLDFYVTLLASNPSAKFLFISNDKQEILDALKAKNISEDRIIIHSAKRNEVPLFISLSNMSIFFIKPLYSKKASSPTKMGEIMAMGIPIVTNTGVGDCDKIIEASEGGVLVREFTNKAYEKAIEQMLNITQLEKAKEVANTFFSLDRGVELYDSVYQKVARTY